MLLLYLAVVKQIPRKLASTDTRQSAADIVSVRLLVGGGTVQQLGVQSPEFAVIAVVEGYLAASQCMLHLAHPVSIVVAVSVYFLSCSLSGSGK